MPLSELSRRRFWAQIYRRIFLLLIALAVVSTVAGVRNAIHNSQDMQWSGAHVLAVHLDPWGEYLRGDQQHRFVQSQVPNYLAITYLLMLPFGVMPLAVAKAAWAICNVGCAIASGVLASRFYGIRGRGVVTVVCLLLMATPTRTTIGNGQQGLLVLLLWCLGLLVFQMNGARAAIAGLAYGKFTFMPPMLLFLWLRWGWRAVLWSVVPALSSLLLVWWWITGGHDPKALVVLAKEPFRMARVGYSWGPGDQNLMALLEPLLRWLNNDLRDTIELAVALSVCAAVSLPAYRRSWSEEWSGAGSVRWQMALMATMSYSLFKHHPYDAVVLLFPLCYALRMWRERSAKIVLGLLAYLFYGQRLLEAAHLHPAWAHGAEFGLLMVMLRVTYRMREVDQSAAPLRLPAERMALVH